MKDYIIDKIGFKTLLGLTAIITAIVAAYFSVFGISTLFAGAVISVAVMATMLEISKIVAVIYLYRYWKETKKWLTAYLSIALVILMVITSAGIFGYLSAAYSKSSTAYKAQQEQIVLVEKTRIYAQNKIDQAQNRMLVLNRMRESQESRMAEAMTNSFISRNPIQLKQLQDQTAEMIKTTETDTKAEQTKIDSAIKEIGDIDKKINEMRYADNNKDIRTFEFVAKLFNTTLDNIAKWFIFLLIVVFDPLAVALILAYNVVVYKKKTELVIETPVLPVVEMVNEVEPLKKV